MALEGFTIGSGGSNNTATPSAAPSPAPVPSTGALSGFTIGTGKDAAPATRSSAAPAAPAPAPVPSTSTKSTTSGSTSALQGFSLKGQTQTEIPGIDRPFTAGEAKQFQPIVPPAGAKEGQVFKGADGNMYTVHVQGPSLQDLGKNLYEAINPKTQSGLTPVDDSTDATDATTPKTSDEIPSAKDNIASYLESLKSPVDQLFDRQGKTTISAPGGNTHTLPKDTIWSKIGRVIAPQFLQHELGIASDQRNIELSPADRIKEQGSYETGKLADLNPEKIDPMVYLARGIGFGHDPVNDIENSFKGADVNYTLSKLPEPKSFSPQWFAQQIGNVLTLSVAQPLVEASAARLLAEVPGGSAALEKLSQNAAIKPWTVGYASGVAKAIGTGGLFGLITKNKLSVAQNALSTAGTFGFFEALAYPVLSFFKPILESVGSQNIYNPSALHMGVVGDLENQPISPSVWFKNPNDPTQFIKVTQYGVDFVEQPSGTTDSTEIGAPKDAPTISRVEIEAFKQTDNPIYAAIKGWIDGKAPAVENIAFEEADQPKDVNGDVVQPAEKAPADMTDEELSQKVKETSSEIQKTSEIAEKVAPLEKERAPSVLQVTNVKTGESTMQAIKPEDLEKFKSLIDTGDSNKAQALQDATGNSYHLTATTPERMAAADVKALPGYADHESISKIASNTSPFKESILNEARQYNTPEEFSKAIQYHGLSSGGHEDILNGGFKNANEGVFVASKGEASEYGKSIPVLIKKGAESLETSLDGKVSITGTSYKSEDVIPLPNNFNASKIHKEAMKSASDENKIADQVKLEALQNSPAKTLNMHFGRSSDTIGQQLENAKGTDRARFIQDKVSELGYGDTDEAQEALDDYKAQRLQLQGGFVNPGQILEDIGAKVKQITDLVEKDAKTTKLTGTVTDAIYQHEGMRKANRQRLINLVEDVGNMLDAQGWEDLYHHDENSAEKITPEEQKVYDTVIVPLKTALTSARAQYRELGGTITTDLQSEMTPRFAKEKGGPIDAVLNAAKGAKKAIANGGLLSKSVGSGAKSREYHIATDESGKRTVVHITSKKNGTVTGFKNGVLTDLGPTNKVVPPKVREFYDKVVMGKLEELAKNLGITHERIATAKSEGLGGRRAGVSFQGQDKIKTRIGPESVIIHEIGHQIDHKYDLQAMFNDKTLPTQQKEIRALADLRWNGDGNDASDSFKKYVRSGPEKMAAMFEAYLHVPDQFKAVAPHLYDHFVTFLGRHPDIAPILDIKPSMVLGMTKHGGNLTAGLSGGTFVDNTGKSYTIGQATTKEIEANTKTRYHKNVLANYIISYDRTLNALNAMKLLERIKSSPEFGDIIVKDDPDEAPPLKWESVSDVLPQFRGYHMEPKLAEALRDLASRQKGREYFPILDEINNVLTTAIVLNPIMHFPNVAQGWGAAEAGSGKIPGLSASSRANLMKAITEVRNKGPLYLSYVEHGAPFMSLKETAKNFTDAILTQYTEEVTKNPKQYEALSKILGYANPVAWAKGLGKVNEAITWGGNDILFMHALLDHADKYGTSMEESIKAVSKRMADYRLPSRIGPGKLGRALSLTAQSRAFMFARYHYSGVIKPWIENISDTVRPGSTGKERIAGLRSLAYLALMGLLVYPLIDKALQGITGSKNTYMSMAGPVKMVQSVEKLAQTGVTGASAFAQSTLTLSPVMTALTELGFNVDLYTRNPIYGPLPAEGMTAFGTSMVAPLSSASRMTPGDFAFSLFGIYTPKSQSGKIALQAMKYDELPALEVQVKKDIVSGNVAKANAEMKEFNNRAIANYNTDMLQTGGKPLPADGSENEAFLKEWGIAVPGAKALANASALYGNGSLTSKSSLVDKVVTYAKAIGTDPVDAFNDIFKGQNIIAVDNASFLNQDAAVIVERDNQSESNARDSIGKAEGRTPADMKNLQLDHIIPLEDGGINDMGNYQLVSSYNNEVLHGLVENPISAALKAGTISRAHAREYIIRYKAGTLGEALTSAMLDEYKTKYGSQPITAAEVADLIKSGKAK